MMVSSETLGAPASGRAAGRSSGRSASRAGSARRSRSAATRPPVCEQVVDLGEARVDADDRRGALGEQVVAEAAAPVHLDEQAAELAQRVLARLQQRAPLTAEQPGVRATRGDTLRRVARRRRSGDIRPECN